MIMHLSILLNDLTNPAAHNGPQNIAPPPYQPPEALGENGNEIHNHPIDIDNNVNDDDDHPPSDVHDADASSDNEGDPSSWELASTTAQRGDSVEPDADELHDNGSPIIELHDSDEETDLYRLGDTVECPIFILD